MSQAPNLRVQVDPVRTHADTVLADIVSRIHVSDAAFVRGEFSAPWAVTAADVAPLHPMPLRAGAHRVQLLVVVQGSFQLALDTGECAQVEAGDAVVLPYGGTYTMGHPQAAAPVMGPVEHAEPAAHGGALLRQLGGGAPTRLLCGHLHCEDLLFNAVLAALPRLIHVRPDSSPAAQWRLASLGYAAEMPAHPGTPEALLLARLPELVLEDCLLQFARSQPRHGAGWLAALRDPLLARALALLHDQPARPWTVAGLAKGVAVSRSVLAERFVHVLAVSPMRYLARWRLQLAADLLRDEPHRGVASIADRVGYASEAAFSRAFKRHLGLAPMAWRKGDRLGEGRVTVAKARTR